MSRNVELVLIPDGVVFRIGDDTHMGGDTVTVPKHTADFLIAHGNAVKPADYEPPEKPAQPEAAPAVDTAGGHTDEKED